MIAGSSVKGAVRAYAEKIGLDKQYIAVLFGADDELAKEAAMPESAGYLVWHDAWWVPEGNNKPFVGEIVTVHHQDYYAGNGAATDFDSPVPNQQLAIQGSFYFVVEGDTAWVNLAINLLRGTLKQQGIGSKRAAGYGFMSENTELKDKLSKKLEEDKEQARKEQEATKLLAEMASLTDNQKQIQEFVIKLSKNSTWQTGQAGNDKGGFLDIYNQVSQWENSEDIKFAIKMFEEQVLKWLKISKLNQNPNWRDKINTLKRKVGLL